MSHTLRSKLYTALLTAGLAAFGGAFAIGTPANTPIENTATLTYKDALATPRAQASNSVVVTVRQVYAVSVTPDAPVTAIPTVRQYATFAGGTRLIPYTVQNAGNGDDTLTLAVIQDATDGYDATTRIFRDIGCDNVPDGAAITSLFLPAAQGGVTDRACILVEASVPAGTSDNLVSRLALGATSVGYTAITDADNYAQLAVLSSGQLLLSKAVSPTGNVNPGQVLTYTVSASVPSGNPVGAVTNVVTVDGVPRTGVLIRDVLNGTVFGTVTSATASSGTASALYSTDGGLTWSATQPTSGVNAVALLAEGTGAFLAPGAALTLSFTAAVPQTALASTIISNTASATLDGNNDGDGGDTGETPDSPAVTSGVNTVAGAAVGPFTFAQGGASGSYTLNGIQIDRSGDTQTSQTAIVAGTGVTFRQSVQNTGNAQNALTVAVSGAPAGWVCTVQNIDVTNTLSAFSNPLTLAAGATAEIAVHCDVPLAAAGASNTALTVSATPQGGVADSSTDVIAQVTAAGLPLLGNGDGNPATVPTQAPVVIGANPGQNALFPLELQNGGPVPEAFTLNGSQSGTQFFVDTNGNGLVDDGNPALTVTPAVPAGQTLLLVAAVPVPAGAAGVQNVTFTATSTTSSTRTTSVTDGLQTNAVVSGTFAPNGAQATIAGGTVTYTHTLTNTGNSPATYAVAPFTSPQGWTYTYSTSNLAGATFTPSLSGTLAAGGSTPLFVRVSVPANTLGTPSETALISVTLTAQDAPQPSVGVTASDTTSIQSVTASVVKSVELCLNTLCSSVGPIPADGKVDPLDRVRYSMVVTNNGSSALSGAVLVDTVPTNTDFVAVAGTGLLFSADDGVTWSATAPTALPLGRFWAGVDTNADNRVTDADALAPAATFTVTFTVQVR